MRFRTLLATFSLSLTVVSGAAVKGRLPAVAVETKSLDKLYKLALAEGGNLVVKAGGDEKDQQDAVAKAFTERFPRINVSITVDLSKVLFRTSSCCPTPAWI